MCNCSCSCNENCRECEEKKEYSVIWEISDETPNHMNLHCSWSIGDRESEYFTLPPTEKELQGQNEISAMIAEAFGNIEGLLSVCIYRYEMSIWKGTAFDWDDLIPQILKVMMDTLPL